MCVSNRKGRNRVPVPTCKQSAIISYISPQVFYKEKLKISRVSSPKSAFLSLFSLFIKYSFGVGRGEDSNFHLKNNYNHFKRHEVPKNKR